MLCVLMNTPFTCQCQKEDTTAQGFKISQFYSSFSSDSMAVKGLTPQQNENKP